MDVVRVAIGIPSTNRWVGDFGMCLVNLIAHCARVALVPGKKNAVHLVHSKGSILPRQRWQIIKFAREAKADWLLFVDTDQTFPEDTIHRLLARGKDVIAANVAVKKLPSLPTARNLQGKEYMPVYTDPKSTGVERVDRIGCGLLLIRLSLLDNIPPAELFDIHWREDIEDYQGEDWTMMEALERRGIEVYIDHDLSKEVAHVGDLEYTHELVGVLKREEEKVPWLRRLGIRKHR